MNASDQTKALRKLASELSMAETRERRLIAEDLHDHLGQYLALIRMKLSTFQGNAIFCGQEQELMDIQSLLSKAINYTRHLTMVISPPILYQLGLIPALEWLSSEYSKRHKLKIRFKTALKTIDVQEDIRGLIYRSTRELLLNIVKHAQANKVALKIESNRDKLIVSISDNGVGFDLDTLTSESQSGFGLFSIEERLKYLGGSLSVSSQPGQGTNITLICPVHRKEAR